MTFYFWDLSPYKTLKTGELKTRDSNENTWKRWLDWAAPPLIRRTILHIQSLDIFAHLIPRHNGPSRDSCIQWPQALHENALPRCKLLDDAMCHSNSISSFEAQTHKPSISGLRPKPPKPFGEAYPLRLLHDLDTCHRLSSTA
jgi:hypothetical protein